MGSDLPRTRDARARAEAALVELALAAGDRARDFVVIGGLNPDFLAPSAPVAHHGTTDVDLLIELGMPFDRDELDFGWLDEALQSARPNATGWQWRPASDSGIAIELLCDAPEAPGLPVELPGSSAKALSVLGAAPALFEPVSRELELPKRLRTVEQTTVELQFAGLGGYLLAKAAAYASRRATKDAYDFAYVAVHNDGGPGGAAVAIEHWLTERFASTHRETIRSMLAACIGDARPVAIAYAEAMVEAGSDDELDTLVEDATSAALVLRASLFSAS